MDGDRSGLVPSDTSSRWLQRSGTTAMTRQSSWVHLVEINFREFLEPLRPLKDRGEVRQYVAQPMLVDERRSDPAACSATAS